MKAFETIPPKRGTNVPLFIFGDHSSAHIPDGFDNLGLSGDDLTRHIAVDIGTEGLIRNLCARFGCAGHLAGVSRLVIDCHRDPNAPGLIPPISDGTQIPGNTDISEQDRARRIKDIHTPYHAALTAGLDEVCERSHDPLIVSVHSFTPKLKSGGAFRDVQIGLLCKADIESSRAALNYFKSNEPGFDTRINAPYSAYEFFYTVDVQIAPRGLRHLTFEIRQDLIDTRSGIDAMTQVLERALTALI